MAATRFSLGDFERSRQYAMRALNIWRSGNIQFHTENPYTPVVACLCHKAFSEWHPGEIAFCHALMDEGISIAKELKDVPAMAIAFVSNQRFYDTIYQERYMGLPDDNEEGYKNGSPITFAHQLEGNLLIIHGTSDDNVHYQSCETLINELIKHNKHFAMMAYPGRSHSIKEGENTKRHLFELLTRYLKENLPVGNDSID